MLHNDNASNQKNRFSVLKNFISNFPLILTCLYALFGLFSFFKYSGMNVLHLYVLTTIIFAVSGVLSAGYRVNGKPSKARLVGVAGGLIMTFAYLFYKPLPDHVVGLGAVFGIGLGLFGLVKLLADALIVPKPLHFERWFAVACVLFTGVGLFCLNSVA